ncbi:MAG TPA: 3-oxoacyl-ACP reductase FabG [Polyangiaceae bacterium]|nr:3-oxoacyl-ACP reductase FabG [Polyangiaceae bacterium]
MKPRALVTGASRGIGAAIACELARAGHGVIVNYLSNETAARATVQRIEQEGGRAELCQFDVRDADQSKLKLEQLLQGEPIGVLVNNAGIVRDNPLPALSLDDWQAVTRTTLDGFFNVTQPLMMPMARRRWGRVINIASVSGVIGNRGQTNYAAGKAGLIGATKSLALEFARRNITVNAVAPGLIDTEMIQGAPVAEIVPMIPCARLGKAEEVAHLVRFLASDEAAYITGQVIGINGGLA